MRKIIYFLFALLGISLIINLYFFYKNSNLKLKTLQLEKLVKKIEEEVKFLNDEKEKIFKENEKLKEEALSYTNLAAKLQKKKNELEERIEDFQKQINEKEEELERCQVELDKAKENSQKILEDKESKLFQENKKLHQKISLLESTLKKERALYHYNLGVAYTKANFFEEAIKSYEECLKFDPKIAEAHYNLGLLYENFKKDLKLAILHYQKYLELNPDAEDREEVKKWIDRLALKFFSNETK